MFVIFVFRYNTYVLKTAENVSPFDSSESPLLAAACLGVILPYNKNK